MPPFLFLFVFKSLFIFGYFSGVKLCKFNVLDNQSIPQHYDRPMHYSLERDVAQWLERGALPMSLPTVRFRIPLGGGLSEKYHVSPLSILGHYLDVLSLSKALYPHMLHLTQV